MDGAAPGWVPANETERQMAEALGESDGRRYAELLGSAPLYLPTWSGQYAEHWPEALPPLGDDHIVVFTSPASLYSALGGLASGHQEYDLSSLREQWPGEDRQLVVNPASPIGVYMSVSEVDNLASGQDSLVSVRDVEDATMDALITDVREMCLNGLGSSAETAGNESGRGPANDLERRLTDAVTKLDFDSFMETLIASHVIVPTTEGTSEGADLRVRDKPVMMLGEADTPMVPVFSSEAILDRISPEQPGREPVAFLELLAGWPGERHVLCFNPGTGTELILPGSSVQELAASMNAAGSSEETAP